MKFLLLFLTLAIGSCAYIPVEVKHDKSGCKEPATKVVIKEVDFKNEIERSCGNSMDCMALLIGGAIVIPTTTFMISGTLAIAGNAYYAVEETLTCQ